MFMSVFIFFPRRKKTNQKNAAQEEEGFDPKNANESHFSDHQHPLPLKEHPHLSAKPTEEVKVGNDIDDVVEVVVRELLFELYGQEIADKLDGLVIIEVVHEEFVVHMNLV